MAVGAAKALAGLAKGVTGFVLGSDGDSGDGSSTSVVKKALSAFLSVILFFTFLLASAGASEASTGGGVPTEFPGWVTEEMIEAALIIQDEYGLHASVMFAQAQLEVGGTWDGSSLYETASVAHNLFGLTYSKGTTAKYLTLGGKSVLTFDGKTTSASGRYRGYDSYTQGIYDRAQTLIYSGYYDDVVAAAQISSAEEMEALCDSPWCEGGYDSLSGYMTTYGFGILDNFTYETWTTTGGAGGGAVSSPIGLRWPVDCAVAKTYEDHWGLDVQAGAGTPIYAAANGIVINAEYTGTWGNYVRIAHSGLGIQTGYAHMSSIAVEYGQVVKQGDLLGYVGSTGNSTGPHLHFEIFETSSVSMSYSPIYDDSKKWKKYYNVTITYF